MQNYAENFLLFVLADWKKSNFLREAKETILLE